FDASMIEGNKIVVKNLKENSSFITLDNKERKLSSDDLMICNDRQISKSVLSIQCCSATYYFC
ncbi:MAG: phenylalanine--tRNA ligase beta subunit-related protein, partial [Bacteroidota bacterium]